MSNGIKIATELSRHTFGRRGSRADVSDAACLSCHDDIGTEETFSVQGLRMSHTGLAEAGFGCVYCHRDVAHVPGPGVVREPTMSTCAECHNGVDESAECAVCHLEPETQVVDSRHDQEFSKTHGSNWETLHGMGELTTCRICHAGKCEQCHGMELPHSASFAAEHGASAEVDRETCFGCHTTAFCDSCHGMTMPHPDGFLAEHSSVAEGYDDPLCNRCHVSENCNACHSRHVHGGSAVSRP